MKAPPRCGYHRVWALLRQDAWVVNRKRVHRRWRREGFKAPQKQRNKRRLGTSGHGILRHRAAHKDHVWCYDVVKDPTANGASSYKYRYDHLNQLTAVWNAADTPRKAAYTYDALQRRVEFANDVNASTMRHYYDGANELMEFNTSDVRQRYYVHGLSYIDERIMMMKGIGNSSDRPFYYIQDRLYTLDTPPSRGKRDASRGDARDAGRRVKGRMYGP